MADITHTRSLEELERVIEKGLTSFIETGMALRTIRDGRLYIEAGFDAFEDYCEQRWGFKRTHAQQQIQAVKVLEALDDVHAREHLTEFQLRPLGKLLDEGPDVVRRAWDNIVEMHEGDGLPSGREVEHYMKLGAEGREVVSMGPNLSWLYAFGKVADTMLRAEKELTKAEAMVHRKPNQKLRDSLVKYAAIAEDLRNRLRAVADWKR